MFLRRDVACHKMAIWFLNVAGTAFHDITDMAICSRKQYIDYGKNIGSYKAQKCDNDANSFQVAKNNKT
jgi:hypothetical protein